MHPDQHGRIERNNSLKVNIQGGERVSAQTLNELRRVLGSLNLSDFQITVAFNTNNSISGEISSRFQEIHIFLPVRTAASDVELFIALALSRAMLSFLSSDSRSMPEKDVFDSWSTLVAETGLNLPRTEFEINVLRNAFYELYENGMSDEDRPAEIEFGYVDPRKIDLQVANSRILSSALNEILGKPVLCANPEYPFTESWGYVITLIPSREGVTSWGSEIDTLNIPIIGSDFVQAGVVPCVGRLFLVSGSVMNYVQSSNLGDLLHRIVREFYQLPAPEHMSSNPLFESHGGNLFPSTFITTSSTELNLQQITSAWTAAFSKVFSGPYVPRDQLVDLLGVTVKVLNEILAAIPQHPNGNLSTPIGILLHSLAFVDGFCDFVLVKSGGVFINDLEPWSEPGYVYYVVSKLKSVRRILLDLPDSLSDNLKTLQRNFYTWFNARASNPDD